MSNRAGLSGLVVACLGLLSLGACDIDIDKILEGVAKPGASAPGPNADAGVGTPPPVLPPPDRPVDPTSPPPPSPPSVKACRSTSDCGAGQSCSTAWGDCQRPPGCGPGIACPAVCYGSCQAGKPACLRDADCRLEADYCTGCDCRALASDEKAPTCNGPGVQCLVDPCRMQTAVCSAGRCVVQAPPPPACDDWTVAGDETTCRTQSDWKLHAHEACLAKKMNLADYSVGGGDCGVESTRMVKYQCCPAAPEPPTPPTPGPTPAPGPNTCTGASEGGSSSCKSPAIWKTYATDNCTKLGMALSDIDYGEECGGGNFRYMKYVCCAASTGK